MFHLHRAAVRAEGCFGIHRFRLELKAALLDGSGQRLAECLF